MACLKQTVPKSSRLLKKLQMQGRSEEEPGAYWETLGGTKHSGGIAAGEACRRPSTQPMDVFNSLVGDDDTA